jgi:hypothetical protein
MPILLNTVPVAHKKNFIIKSTMLDTVQSSEIDTARASAGTGTTGPREKIYC